MVEGIEDSHAEWPVDIVGEVLDLDTLSDGDSAPWVEVLEHLGECLWLVGDEAEGSIGDYGISLFVFGHLEGLDVSDLEGDIFDSSLGSVLAGSFDLSLAEIDGDDLTVRSDLVAGDDGVESEPTPEVEDDVAGLNVCEAVRAAHSLVEDVVLPEDVQLLLGVAPSEEDLALISDGDSLVLDLLGDLVVDGLNFALDLVIDLFLVLLVEVDEISGELLAEFFEEFELLGRVNLFRVSLLFAGGDDRRGEFQAKFLERGENSFGDSESVLAVSLAHDDEVGVVLGASLFDLFNDTGGHGLVLQNLGAEDLSEPVGWGPVQGQISA